jgi:hypothetical protein
MPLDLTIDTNCGYCSIIEVPHKQIYGNFYTRSRTIKARPNMVLDFTTTVSVQKLCLLIPPNPPHPKKKFLLNKSCFPCANLLKFIKQFFELHNIGQVQFRILLHFHVQYPEIIKWPILDFHALTLVSHCQMFDSVFLPQYTGQV